jgi:hypothetical protein
MSTKKDFSKKIVSLVVVLNVLFTIAVLYVFLKTDGSEPTSLVVAWFAFTTGELWMLSSIKKTKIREGDQADGRSDYESDV